MHRVTDSTLTVGGVPVDEFHPLEKAPPRRQLVVLRDGTIAVATLADMFAVRPWSNEDDVDPYEKELEDDLYDFDDLSGPAECVAIAIVSICAVVALLFVWGMRAGVI